MAGTDITGWLRADARAEAPAAEAVAALAHQLGELGGLEVYAHSITMDRGALLFLGRRGRERCLGVLSTEPESRFAGETLEVEADSTPLKLRLCVANPTTAAALRDALPSLAPQTLGLQPSIGCGDRLGTAAPGHLRAVRNHGLAPVLAQQSVRELERTSRTPIDVLDAATWGALQEGWHKGYGADADHLKTIDDVNRFAEAGYSMFTIDPGDHVDDAADDADEATLQDKVSRLPWEQLDTSEQRLGELYRNREFDLGGFGVTLSEEDLLRAAAKYGRAVAHTAALSRHLATRMGDRPFEIEVSVDETARPTRMPDHLFVASELERLGVRWVGLAPRFVGQFEKAVDYVGDLEFFEAELAKHAMVARALGPYKISLHSGSDKFSVYPVAANCVGDLVHVKTAGTSYLEALRVIATEQPTLFREILGFALERFDEDRATYHISAEKQRVLDPTRVADADLPVVLDRPDGRQVLHVTFGSVLSKGDLRDRLLVALDEHEDAHHAGLAAHFERHLAPFDE